MFHLFVLLFWLITCPGLSTAEELSCPVLSNVTFVPSIALAEVHYASASLLAANLAEPWPIITSNKGRQLRLIKYCFETAEARNLLKCKVQDALSLWSKGLGPPGNGHSLAWQEVNNNSKDPKTFSHLLCYHDQNWQGLGLLWNDKVKDDTLVVRYAGDTRESTATVGYKGNANKGKHPHSLTLGGDTSVAIAAHELGHVLGMVHEHTRNDRDGYIVYKCDRVNGYYQALSDAMQTGHGHDEAATRLCSDIKFAAQFGFRGTAFTKNDELSTLPDQWGALDEPGGFDIDSIMMYASYTFCTPLCYQDVEYCPLARIKKGHNGEIIGSAYLGAPLQPSKGDVEWVKRNYPPLPDVTV